MDKWEYLRCYMAPHWIDILPVSKVNVDWLLNKYPQIKVDKAEPGFLRVSENKEIITDLYDYLGSQGWEAYAVDGNNCFFKRRL